MVALQSKILARLVFGFSLLFVGNSGRTTVVAMMKDTATGIPFDDKSKGGLNIFGVGCRKKGPIKVYSCGMYCTEKVQEDLSTISLSGSKKKALSALRKGSSENPTAFVLKMNFKVGAEKMASAIADSVSPRHSSESEVSQLKELIFKGVSEKGAAVKGTEISFDCSDCVEVTVDGKNLGNVPSPGLAQAFRNVYLDDKCVSPKLRENILENCCAP